MRNRILLACVGLTLTLLAAFGHQSPISNGFPRHAQSNSAAAQRELPDLLEMKSKAAWAAFKNRDKHAYAELLTDDFEAVEADGDGERSKERLLQEVGRSMYTEYLLQLFQVQQLGPSYAFVTYEATIQFPRGSATRYRRVFVGELWSLRNGQWKMMRYQETPVR